MSIKKGDRYLAVDTYQQSFWWFKDEEALVKRLADYLQVDVEELEVELENYAGLKVFDILHECEVNVSVVKKVKIVEKETALWARDFSS